MGSHWKERKPCEKCGGTKRPGQGQRYCEDCYQAARWRAERRRSTRVVRDREPCQRCGGKKEPGHGRRFCERCLKVKHQTRRCRDCDIEIAFPKKLCELCKAVAVAKRRAYDIERHRLYRETHPTRPRVRPKATVADREDQRIRYRLRAEQAGRSVGPARVTPRSRERTEVPTAPLLPYLHKWLAEGSVTVLGEIAKVRPYDISRVAEGRITSIRLAQADKLCVALGLHFDNVYAVAV
jgi:hypothetical protein